MKKGIVVRVVRAREARRSLGGVVSMLGLITTMALISDRIKFGSPDISEWVLLGAVALWTIGPLLPGRPKPITGLATVETEGNFATIGNEEIPIYGPDVSVAKGERGYSIAVMNRNTDPLFVEVDTEKDARAFLELIG